MSLVINTNVASLNAQRSLQSASELNKTVMERLSSGKKINSASDDAAGFAIIERQTSQIRGLNMAIKNANDGLSLIATADSAAADVTDILQRLRELNVQAQNSTNGTADLSYLRAESQSLVEEIDRIANHTSFNSQKLMDGSLSEVSYVMFNYPYGYGGSGSADDSSPASSSFYVSQNGTVTTTVNFDGGNTETAKSSAAKINATTETSGLKATSRTEGMLEAHGGPVSIVLNGVQVTWESDGMTPDAGIAAINSVSDQTGVKAESARDGKKIYLIDEDGDDILVKNDGPSTNIGVQSMQAYTQRTTLSATSFSFYTLLDPTGLDSFRMTGTTAVTSEGYAEVTTSTGTYAFEERKKPEGGALLQIGADKGQSVSVYVSSFDTDKLGGRQVVRTSINIYGAEGASLSGPDTHEAASFRVIRSETGETFELNLGSGPWYLGSDFNWNKELVAAGLGDKLRVSMFEEDNSGDANYRNALRFTSMEDFGDFDVVWSSTHGHSIPSGFVDGQSIIDQNHEDHTQNPHVGTLSNMFTYSLDVQLQVIDTALNQTALTRAGLGASANRLAYTVSNLSTVSKNTQYARSQIRDTDFAVESARLTKAQLLQTSASAMIAQANASGAMVLQLIR